MEGICEEPSAVTADVALNIISGVVDKQGKVRTGTLVTTKHRRCQAARVQHLRGTDCVRCHSINYL